MQLLFAKITFNLLGQQHKEAVIIDACLLFNSDLIFGRIQLSACYANQNIWFGYALGCTSEFFTNSGTFGAVVGLKVSKLAEKELTCQCFGHILE